jgi:hypothetical protein
VKRVVLIKIEQCQYEERTMIVTKKKKIYAVRHHIGRMLSVNCTEEKIKVFMAYLVLASG